MRSSRSRTRVAKWVAMDVRSLDGGMTAVLLGVSVQKSFLPIAQKYVTITLDHGLLHLIAPWSNIAVHHRKGFKDMDVKYLYSHKT